MRLRELTRGREACRRLEKRLATPRKALFTLSLPPAIARYFIGADILLFSQRSGDAHLQSP